MKLFVGGARGSRVVTDSAFVAFGGDTTSFLVEGGDGDVIAIDGGSGFGHIVDRLLCQDTAMLLFTHYHLDHLNGLPACVSALNEYAGLRIAGPVWDNRQPSEVLAALLRQPYWPVAFDDAKLLQITVGLDPYKGSEGFVFGGLRIRWCDLAHPGGAIAYRIDDVNANRGLVIATDCEWSACSAAQQDGLRTLCTDPYPVQMLIMDAQYDDAEYASRRGWGHSTWREAVDLAVACGVERLAITHHDPGASDEALHAREQAVQSVCPASCLLRQNDVLDI